MFDRSEEQCRAHRIFELEPISLITRKPYFVQKLLYRNTDKYIDTRTGPIPEPLECMPVVSNLD